VQLLDQPITLVLIDHEGEVEVVGRLAHEIDLLLLEELESAAELMEYAAYVAPDEAHRGTGADDLHAAQPRELGDQLRHTGIAEGVRRGIE
jgi:hypothetical protein